MGRSGCKPQNASSTGCPAFSAMLLPRPYCQPKSAFEFEIRPDELRCRRAVLEGVVGGSVKEWNLTFAKCLELIKPS